MDLKALPSIPDGRVFLFVFIGSFMVHIKKILRFVTIRIQKSREKVDNLFTYAGCAKYKTSPIRGANLIV